MRSFLRAAIGLLLLMAGCVLIAGVAVFSARAAVTKHLAENPVYLHADNQLSFAAGLRQPGMALIIPAVQAESKAVLQPAAAADAILTPFAPSASPASGQSPPQADLTYHDESLGLSSEPKVLQATPTSPAEVASATPTATSPAPTSEPAPATQPPVAIPTATPVIADFQLPEPIVRIRIPGLKVKRAVVEIGLVPDGNGGEDWDTDSLFATENRPDLVGHLAGSAFPGEGGNIVLVGHNYNYDAAGIFVNIHKLEDGDKIFLVTESGLEYTYEVFKVKSVPYKGNAADLERHARFLAPSSGEVLTLVTCGGANIGFFNKRVYVVAAPVD